MKRGHYILIAGAAILVIGTVLTIVWALPLAEEFERGATIMQGQQLGAAESVTAFLEVEEIERPLSVIVSAWTEVEMSAVVLDPLENQIFDRTFTEAIAEGANPTVEEPTSLSSPTRVPLMRPLISYLAISRV